MIFLDILRHAVWFAGAFSIAGMVVFGQCLVTAWIFQLNAPRLTRRAWWGRATPILALVGVGVELLFLAGTYLVSADPAFIRTLALAVGGGGVGFVLGQIAPYLRPRRAAAFGALGGTLAGLLDAMLYHTSGDDMTRLITVITITGAIILSELWSIDWSVVVAAAAPIPKPTTPVPVTSEVVVVAKLETAAVTAVVHSLRPPTKNLTARVSRRYRRTQSDQ